MQKGTKPHFFKIAFWALFGLGAVALIFSLIPSGDKPQVLKPPTNAPSGAFDPLTHLLSAEQLCAAPLIDGFEQPCGTQSGGFFYDAQPYGSPNVKRGGLHLGQDINGIGGGNSDLGEPVFAAARGLVVYSGWPSDGWGYVIILAHRLPDGRFVQSLYGHLDRCSVQEGERIARGEILGTIGNAKKKYLAHLHFELIESRSSEVGETGYWPDGGLNRLDPVELFKQYPAPETPDPFMAIRRTIAREIMLQSKPVALPKGSTPVNPAHFIP